MAKVIGHTSSGKPVYAAFQLHRGFADWSADDHNDAADMHRNAARSDIKTNVSMHENSAALHEEEAQRIYKLVQKLGLAPRAAAPAKPRRHHSTRKSPAQLDREIAQVLGKSHSMIKRDEELVPTAEARRHVQTIQRRDEFPEILAISMRVDGTNYGVKVPDPKNKRGYDLVDVLIHHNGMRSIKSASRSRTTPERASRIVTKYLEATR